MRFTTSIVAGVTVGLVAAVAQPLQGEDKVKAPNKPTEVWVLRNGQLVVALPVGKTLESAGHRLVDPQDKGAGPKGLEVDFVLAQGVTDPAGYSKLTVTVERRGTKAGIEGQRLPEASAPQGIGVARWDAAAKTCTMSRELPVGRTTDMVAVTFRATFAEMPTGAKVNAAQGFIELLFLGTVIASDEKGVETPVVTLEKALEKPPRDDK